MSASRLTGGCQCGAIRFSCERVSHASICHCRMCQKAMGNVFSPLAEAEGLFWTRGAPKRFHSSNVAQRGFCADCGTPLTYETEGRAVEIAICAFDNPAQIAPALQLAMPSRLPWVDHLAGLPTRSAEEQAKREAHYARIVSYQHPDHNDPDWKPRA